MNFKDLQIDATTHTKTANCGNLQNTENVFSVFLSVKSDLTNYSFYCIFGNGVYTLNDKYNNYNFRWGTPVEYASYVVISQIKQRHTHQHTYVCDSNINLLFFLL